MSLNLHHPDLGKAQAVKHIILKQLVGVELIGGIDERIVSLWNPKQQRDFCCIALSKVRDGLELGDDTGQVIPTLDNIPVNAVDQTPLLDASNEALVFQPVKKNETLLSHPYAFVKHSFVYDKDIRVNQLVDALNTSIDNAKNFRPSREFVKDRANANKPDTYTGLSLSLSLRQEKPTIVFSVIRNTELKKAPYLDDFLEGLRQIFGDWIGFEFVVRRWSWASNSIFEVNDGSGFNQNYFSRSHTHLRPGLSVETDHGTVGSLLCAASSHAMRKLFPRVAVAGALSEEEFAISCRHVFYHPTNSTSAQIQRPYTNRGNLKIGHVLQRNMSKPWWSSTASREADTAFAKVDRSVWKTDMKVAASVEQIYELRLPEEEELFDVMVDAECMLLGIDGAVKGVTESFDDDGSYLLRTPDQGPLLLPATGLRLVRSGDKAAGKPGNSGGPVVVHLGEKKPGQAVNVIAGMRVAGDRGKRQFTGPEDPGAPNCLYLPIVALASEWDRINSEFTESVENDVRDSRPDVEDSITSSESPIVDNGTKMSDLSKALGYYSFLMSAQKDLVDPELLSALKREVRRMGGRVLSSSVKKDPETSEITVELRLANREFHVDAVELEKKYESFDHIEFSLNNRQFIAGAQH